VRIESLRRSSKRLGQHPIKTLFGRVAELRDADDHAVVPSLGLRSVGPEQVVPPRQIEAEIAALALEK
jgi:hypothetical protein